jgi:hypothetical protein
MVGDDRVCYRLRLSTLFLLVFVQDGLQDLLRLLLALVEAVGVCAYYENAKVYCEVSNVYVKDKLLRDTWDTDRSPGFTTIFHAGIGINVIHKHLNILRFHLSHLFRVRED